MNSHVVLSLFHLFVIVPSLLYVAFQRAASAEWVYWTVFVVGLILLLVHSVKAAYKYILGSSSLWVNLFHALLIAPLLIYIGYNGKKTPRAAYEILAIAAFGALGYHAYNIAMQVSVLTD
jgi:bacteriorhodopsin